MGIVGEGRANRLNVHRLRYRRLLQPAEPGYLRMPVPLAV